MNQEICEFHGEPILLDECPGCDGAEDELCLVCGGKGSFDGCQVCLDELYSSLDEAGVR